VRCRKLTILRNCTNGHPHRDQSFNQQSDAFMSVTMQSSYPHFRCAETVVTDTQVIIRAARPFAQAERRWVF